MGIWKKYINMRGSRNSRQGGPGQADKKSSDNVFFFFFFFFFSPQLILQKSNGQFQINLSFVKVPEGVQLFPGGSNCLFPIETHITCDFPGGEGFRTPCPPPPLDPHLINRSKQLLLSCLAIVELQPLFH